MPLNKIQYINCIFKSCLEELVNKRMAEGKRWLSENLLSTKSHAHCSAVRPLSHSLLGLLPLSLQKVCALNWSVAYPREVQQPENKTGWRNCFCCFFFFSVEGSVCKMNKLFGLDSFIFNCRNSGNTTFLITAFPFNELCLLNSHPPSPHVKRKKRMSFTELSKELPFSSWLVTARIRWEHRLVSVSCSEWTRIEICAYFYCF